MSRDPSVFDVAVEQFRRFDAPTVVVPIAYAGHTGVVYVSYRGDDEWMEQARLKGNQADLAIACCKRAYADAPSDACPRPRGTGRRAR